VHHLRLGLRALDRIVYSANGNRAMTGKAFLRKIEKIAPRVGLTRVANISYLSPANYPVFQSCRPNVLYHYRTGQNTGAQGKGPNLTQATISCIMETIEHYCCEPRTPTLIRASYNFLRSHHQVLDPQRCVCAIHDGEEVDPPDHHEPLVWTPAYCVELDAEVLVPAQLVYFPIIPDLHLTRSFFPGGSNGLASGATYLEATIHALYEVIERYYTSLLQDGKLKVEAIHEEELANAGIQEFLSGPMQDLELQVYAGEIAGIRNLPYIFCIIAGSDRFAYGGYGCSATVDISIDRAISEALQGHATLISGSREDMDGKAREKSTAPRDIPFFGKTDQPDKRTLRVREFRKRVHDRSFATLNDEYKFLVDWIHKLGFEQIFFANLTRVGIDIPVVKAIIPEMQAERSYRTSASITHNDVLNSIYPNANAARTPVALDDIRK
jgi:ribosomal protein S12 methylthiotransferase accessory factor